VRRRQGDERAAAEAEARFRRISGLHVEMQSLQARLEREPADPPTRLKLARVYRDLGLLSEAAGEYAAYLREHPDAREVEREYRELTAQAASAPREQEDAFAPRPLP
jgi:thioredoxin-like negative regulator of GroEL